MSPRTKVLLTGITAALIPVSSIGVYYATRRFGVQAWQTGMIGAIATTLLTIYKYMSPSPTMPKGITVSIKRED
jgi:hypothetical protein